MKNVLAALIVWPVAIFIGGWLFLQTGPALEGKFAPILGEQSITSVDRAGDKVCWNWAYIKLRDATPETFAFTFQISGRGVRIPAVVLRGYDRLPLVMLRTRPPGPGNVWLCAVIPDEMKEIKGVTIAGSAEYETNHHLWTLWQALPLVTVPDS